MNRCLGVPIRVLAIALAFTPGFTPNLAAAQATSNESVNARLLVSVRTGDDAGVQRALADGAAVDSRNRLGESALLVALKRSDWRWRSASSTPARTSTRPPSTGSRR
jgi:hypothetical protein